MRTFLLLLALGFVLCSYAWERTNVRSKSLSPTASHLAPNILNADASQPATKEANSTKIDFPTQIKPILQAKCQPCHFSGGQMYQQLPFDRPETVKTLGAKLFTRIKNEKEQRLIRDFLAQ